MTPDISGDASPITLPLVPPDPQPADPSDVRPADPPLTQTCCGNILITGNSPSILIWERDASLQVSAVQATVYALPDNTEPIRLLIESDQLHEMDVAPGNTVNYLGQQVRRLFVTVPGAGSSCWAEGKYAVSVNR